MRAYYRPVKLVSIVILSIIFFAGLLSQLNKTAQAATAAELDVCATCTYTTIQTAVAAANSGDTIRVAQGTYQDTVVATGLLTTTVLITKDLTLLGGFSPDFQTQDPSAYETIIDGQNIAKGIYIFGADAHIEGFTVINGLSHGIFVRVDFDDNLGTATIVKNQIHHNSGSGIVFYRAAGEVLSNTLYYNLWEGIALSEATATIVSNTVSHNNLSGIWAGDSSTTTISGNQIMSNTSESGAGITLDSSTQFTVTSNVINGNQALSWSGGGIAINGGATGMIAYNEIAGNETADHGGGISTYQNGELTISHNNIHQNTAQYGGGGIHVNAEGDTTPLTIEYNTFYTNTAEYGAGLHVINTNGPVQIVSNDIRFNQVTGEDYQSGGIHVDNTGGMVTVANNVVAHNDNRGVKGVNYIEIELINNTIVGNGSQAIEMHAWPVVSTVPLTATIINNIIADHPECAFSGFNNAVYAVHNNDVVGHDPDDCGAEIVSQSDNINADPQFVNPSAGNYQLQVGSPALDSGMSGPNIPAVDIHGTNRPQGSGVDMGAFEAVFQQVFLPMVIKPSIVPPNNFIVENRTLGQSYSSFGGDVHTWLSATDGWGFAPQDPTDVTFFRWNGTKWNSFQTLPSGGQYCYGADLQMLSATDGWALTQRDCTYGPSTFFHWNGSQWSEVQSGIDAGIWAMDFRSANDGWAVGYASGCCGAKFFHWDGVSWTEKTYLVSQWPNTDIALVGNNDGWAVGATIARQSGDSWVVYGSPVAESLRAISMVTANDGWIVGEAGTILHWDGAAWTPVSSPTTEELWDIEMLQDNHGWAVGDNGVILRWNGVAWSLVTSPVSSDFRDLDMVAINEGWIPYRISETSTYGVLHITTP